MGQQILALPPLLPLVIAQGALGFLVAFGVVASKMGIIRAERPHATTKIGLMVAVLVAGAAVDLLVAHTLTSALGR